MRKAIITLKDGRQFEYESQYVWSSKDELNDTRTAFIEMGNYIFRKDEISNVEIIDLEKEEDKNE